MATSVHLSTSTVNSEAVAATPSSCKPHNEAAILKYMKSFLAGMGYSPLNINLTNEKLEEAMREEMDARDIRCEQLEKTLHLAASLIEVGYHGCDFEEKKNIALLCWYHLYVDDRAARDITHISVFEQRFVCGQQQLDPVLNALADVLRKMWKQYEPLCANLIVGSTCDLLTSQCIEPRLEILAPICDMPGRFPWFMRDRSGAGVAYAAMIFSRSAKVDIMKYIQAIPDMNFWIDVSNDILSFYKEELNGETFTHVHTRANADNKSPLQVLAELVEEIRVSRENIHVALASSPEALKAWQTFEHGYVLSAFNVTQYFQDQHELTELLYPRAWHLSLDRYKLKGLDL
ncbi:terpenoid synthase [Ramaria rubella]|nr:terpenoid synthase [Ramaria rubella]